MDSHAVVSMSTVAHCLAPASARAARNNAGKAGASHSSKSTARRSGLVHGLCSQQLRNGSRASIGCLSARWYPTKQGLHRADRL
eukprot:1891017-Pyramimonas_sp.AAC.1